MKQRKETARSLSPLKPKSRQDDTIRVFVAAVILAWIPSRVLLGYHDFEYQ